MTGPEHYREAEQLLSDASYQRDRNGHPVRKDGTTFQPGEHAALIARAQVHATLALAAATAAQLADRYVGDGAHINNWQPAIGWKPELPKEETPHVF
ncbi:hypothetical protein [Streptomyces sp. NPDC006784]|uniref:hypothetical protein n=1 Tax=Streptomyces sp. NPDC006784 TaxID=3364764 RepID=UPI00367A78D6